MTKTPPAEMLSDIQSAHKAKSGGVVLTDWEKEFVDDIARILGRNGILSSAQAQKLEQIWDKI